jgi:lipoprotein-anchoring transpeptidase ErfK/SrfK
MLRRLSILAALLGVLMSLVPAVALAETTYTPSSSSTSRLQEALKDKGFYRGSVNGVYDTKTKHAVMAFRKEIGASRSYSWSNSLWDELDIYQAPYTEYDEPDRVEVNLAKQTAHLFRDGRLVATFPVSSGNGERYFANGVWKVANTPTGNFEVYRHASGWYESSLGLGFMLSPWFFVGGIALHGSTEVPPYPASHGCIRLTQWDSAYLDKHIFIGMPVHVIRSNGSPVYGSDGPFADVPADHTFVEAVQWMVDQGVTDGCSLYFYCPDARATRGEIAAFMKRALQPYLGAGPPVEFTDMEGHQFEAAAEWLAGLGITKGCNPPANTEFCPDRTVNRGEMAAMFMRAAEAAFAIDPDSIDTEQFIDTRGHTFQTAAAWLATAGVTLGCNPPANDEFCPNSRVTRGQLSAFLKRIVDRF